MTRQGEVVFGIARTFKLETTEGQVAPVVGLVMYSDSISMYVQFCDDEGQQGHPLNGNNITEFVKVASLPCALGLVSLDESIGYLTELINGIAGDEIDVDERIYEVKGWNENSMIEILIDT